MNDVIDKVLTEYLRAIWPVEGGLPGIRSDRDTMRLRDLLRDTVEKATAGSTIDQSARCCMVATVDERPEIVCFSARGISLVTYADGYVNTNYLGWPRASVLREKALTENGAFGAIVINATKDDPPLRISFKNWGDPRFEPLFELLTEKLGPR